LVLSFFVSADGEDGDDGEAEGEDGELVEPEAEPEAEPDGEPEDGGVLALEGEDDGLLEVLEPFFESSPQAASASAAAAAIRRVLVMSGPLGGLGEPILGRQK
jgi:hypothetical protein